MHPLVADIRGVAEAAGGQRCWVLSTFCCARAESYTPALTESQTIGQWLSEKRLESAALALWRYGGYAEQFLIKKIAESCLFLPLARNSLE